jgi:hypothetical protein
MRTALDSSVVSALLSAEPTASFIEPHLAHARDRGGLVVCGPVYVELAAHPKIRTGWLDNFLLETEIAVDFVFDEPIWRQSAIGFATYAARRRQSRGDAPKRLLADFVIAAHALLRADQLMTLDSRRYARDFPSLRIVPLPGLRNQ